MLGVGIGWIWVNFGRSLYWKENVDDDRVGVSISLCGSLWLQQKQSTEQTKVNMNMMKRHRCGMGIV